jgi:hypothetical protein
MEAGNNVYTQTTTYEEDKNNPSTELKDTRSISNDYQAYNEYLYSKNPKENEKTWADKIIIEKKKQINYEDPEVQKTLPLWLQKGPGEEKYITPLWKRKLAELESPFINDTIKGIIADCVESKSKMRMVVMKEDMSSTNANRIAFQHLNYASIFYDEDRFMKATSNRNLKSNLFQYFAHSNSMIHPHINQDNIYTESDPFMRLFDKKINSNIPQTQMEKNRAIRQIQEIFRIEAMEETMANVDPDQLLLEWLASKTELRLRTEMQEIKPLFLTDKALFKKENKEYIESIKYNCVTL